MNTRRLSTAVALLAIGGFTSTMICFGDQSATSGRYGGTGLQARSEVPGSGCQNLFAREPVLLFDETGGTLVGPSHLHVAVYGDGLATYARISATVPDGEISVRTLSPSAVQDLCTALAEASAGGLCDDGIVVTDVPLSTVTFLPVAGTESSAHTFSYYLPAPGGQAAVDSIIRGFISQEFEPQ